MDTNNGSIKNIGENNNASTTSSQADEWELIQEKSLAVDLKAKQVEEEKLALIEAKKKYVDDRFARLKEEKKAFEEEKASMTKEIVSHDDIIQLNVGGENLNARRDTLCLCKDSLLASMFSGRWEESLPKLQDGRFFLDYDPECFKQILNQLREMRLTQCCDFPVPTEFHSSQQKKHFFMLAKYLGVLRPNQKSPIPLFEPNSSVATSYNNDKRSQTVQRHQGHQSQLFLQTPVLNFVGTNPICWKVQIQTLGSWILIGIISENSLGEISYNSPTSYGWANHGQVWVNGSNQKNLGGWDGWQVDDEATIKLDPDSRTLQMSHKRGLSIQTFQLDVGSIPRAGWRLHLNLFGENDKIEVSSIHSDEMFSF